MSLSKRPILRTVSHAERQSIGRDHRFPDPHIRRAGDSGLDFSGLPGSSGRKRSFLRKQLEGVRSFFLGT